MQRARCETARALEKAAALGRAGDAEAARGLVEAHRSRAAQLLTRGRTAPCESLLADLERAGRELASGNRWSTAAEATLQALELGAVDCVAKPATGGADAFAALADKVKAAAQARPRAHQSPAAPAARGPYAPDGRLLAIGSSTGGVEALMKLIEQFPANCPPTVITQHMPATFTKSFAQRMDRACDAQVSEAVDGDLIAPGRIYLAPGGENHLSVEGAGQLRCRLTHRDPVNGHRPSVDVLFNSVARIARARAVGVILTGMGRDGAAGLLAMREAGASTLGQDEASSVVYGMPKAAFEIGAVQRQLPLEKIGAEILKLTNAKRPGEA